MTDNLQQSAAMHLIELHVQDSQDSHHQKLQLQLQSVQVKSISVGLHLFEFSATGGRLSFDSASSPPQRARSHHDLALVLRFWRSLPRHFYPPAGSQVMHEITSAFLTCMETLRDSAHSARAVSSLPDRPDVDMAISNRDYCRALELLRDFTAGTHELCPAADFAKVKAIGDWLMHCIDVTRVAMPPHEPELATSLIQLVERSGKLARANEVHLDGYHERKARLALKLNEVEGRLAKRMQDLGLSGNMKGPSVSIRSPIVSGLRGHRWKKGKFLGRGSGGTVFQYFNKLNQQIAVKEITLKQSTQNQKELEKLLAEIELCMDCRHANIVQYFDFDHDRTENRILLYMEYCSKGSLINILDGLGTNRGLSEPQAARYTLHILLGLRYLHGAEKHIVHRDIKCGNILVNELDVAKLADFGVSKQLKQSHTEHGEINDHAGTVVYMAPEVLIKTTGGSGRKADIWSTGCTVLAMLSGKEPWDGILSKAGGRAITNSYTLEREIRLRHKAKETPPLKCETASAEALDFLAQCFLSDPELRPGTDDLLRSAFVGKAK